MGRFIAHSPGCRQSTILEPIAAWQLLPGSGQFVPWDILLKDTTSGSRRGHVSSDATEGRAAESGSSGDDYSCGIERSHSCRTGGRLVDERRERKGPGPPARRRDDRDQTRSDVTGRDGP